MYEEGWRKFTLVDLSELRLDKAQWEALKDRYYELSGWDVNTGVPGRAKLNELGMKDVADKLQGAGKIG